MKKTRKNETGRSMVEMLGVLAIVGVLSAGGVYGYGVAMKKHKANEALHKASLMATTVSAYAMTNDGKLLTSITDFANSGYAITLSDNGTQFNLTLSGIDKDVCTQMQNVKGGMVREVVCDESGNATITYYKNLATTQAEGEKSPTGPDPACTNVKCPDGATCFRGQCQCSNGLFVCGTECCAEGTYCARGANTSTYICTEPTSGCTQNGDCKDADGNVDTTKYCKLSASNYTGPTDGICSYKGTLTPKTFNLPKGILTVYKGSPMNWWSAFNLCQSHGKQMVTMADLGLADSGTNTNCYFNSEHSSYATKPCICNGGSDSDCSATNMAIRNADGTADYLWLADDNKLSSDVARGIRLSSGVVDWNNRHGNSYPICRDP